jgi:glycosyltransferase involved in cell wall biosynthesis
MLPTSRPKETVSLAYTVVICAYTLERWDLLREAVDSARSQDIEPAEIVVCIDHNPDLLALAEQTWGSDTDVTVIQNRFGGRLGSARNSAMEIVTGDVVAFLDDDARAAPDWLSRLEAIYHASTDVQAVGGGPKPRYEVPRPNWIPLEFDWVFGCAYRGLPTERAATGRLIGASMSARRLAILAVDGFHSDNHDDMDLSHRLIAEFGHDSVIYDPAIQVSHYVTRQRLTWGYFWHRCFDVNRGKVLAFQDMGHAGNQSADVDFVRHALLVVLPEYLADPFGGGWRRAGALLAGIALAGLGNLTGRLSVLAGRTEPSQTRGLASSRATALNAAH